MGSKSPVGIAATVGQPSHDSILTDMRWRLVSDDAAREMYSSGKGNQTARRFARAWARIMSLGLLPKRRVVLEVIGRRSGEVRRFPLGMAGVGSDWYLVSMLGECAWTRNVQAAGGRVVLRRRRRLACTLDEVPVADRGPILQRYVEKVPGGRPHIRVPIGAPTADSQAVAPRYPVFRVMPDLGIRPS